jgi:hypothetical protein
VYVSTGLLNGLVSAQSEIPPLETVLVRLALPPVALTVTVRTCALAAVMVTHEFQRHDHAGVSSRSTVSMTAGHRLCCAHAQGEHQLAADTYDARVTSAIEATGRKKLIFADLSFRQLVSGRGRDLWSYRHALGEACGADRSGVRQVGARLKPDS